MKELHSSFQRTAKLYNIQPLRLNLVPTSEKEPLTGLTSLKKSKTRAPSPKQEDLPDLNSRSKSATKKKRAFSPRKLALAVDPVPLDEAWKRANKDISFQLGMSKFSRVVKNNTKFITTLNSGLNEKHFASLAVKSANQVRDVLSANEQLAEIHTALQVVPKRLPAGLEYSRIEAFVANLDDFLEQAKWNIQKIYDPRIPVVIISSSIYSRRAPRFDVYSTGDQFFASLPFDRPQDLPGSLQFEYGRPRMFSKFEAVGDVLEPPSLQRSRQGPLGLRQMRSS